MFRRTRAPEEYFPAPLGLKRFLQLQQWPRGIKAGRSQIGDNDLVCPGILGKVFQNQGINLFQRLCRLGLAEIVSFRQHIQVGNAVFFLQNLQKNTGINAALQPSGDQSDGKGKGGQQAQGLSTEKNISVSGS